ncbi:putative LRR receptor-like serine/threonine-protein kinase isoform X2 [Iris pallida]|uniref:LRR receptor-like serine/threonine-protein kinase isoform X2 n=1 Tax=Iris pallida TaxID=29817 RepID=A0AAX6HM31_IRIPA|nr:putative LRR receptor-like serine/threonine-protein kinase isoform X2 [Iris pallida]
MLNLVLLCTNPSPSARPLMSTVVSMLEGKIPVHLPPLNPSASKLMIQGRNLREIVPRQPVNQWLG